MCTHLEAQGGYNNFPKCTGLSGMPNFFCKLTCKNLNPFVKRAQLSKTESPMSNFFTFQYINIISALAI